MNSIRLSLMRERVFGRKADDMAMPQRDDLIDEIVKTDALLEYAVMHGEVEAAEHLVPRDSCLI